MPLPRTIRLGVTAIILSIAGAASASETISYTYDAKGRLKEVVHSGTVNDGVTATYTFDAADNRIHLTVTGAIPEFIVVPLGGATIIPINAASF